MVEGERWVRVLIVQSEKAAQPDRNLMIVNKT